MTPASKATVILLLTLAVEAAADDSAPKKDTSLLMKKIACTEIGWKFMDRWVAEESTITGKFAGALLEVRYAYNTRMDTCVVGFERLFAHATPSFSHFHIIDTLTGKSLAFANSLTPEQLPIYEEAWKGMVEVPREEDSLRGRNNGQ